MSVLDSYSAISSSVEKMISDANSKLTIILKDPGIGDYPEFSEIKNRRTLYDGYGKISQASYELAAYLSQLYQARDAMKVLRKGLRKDTETPKTLLERPLADCEFVLQRIDDFLEALKAAKDGVDTMVRFFSSAQYILGSPRLEGME